MYIRRIVVASLKYFIKLMLRSTINNITMKLPDATPMNVIRLKDFKNFFKLVLNRNSIISQSGTLIPLLIPVFTEGLG